MVDGGGIRSASEPGTDTRLIDCPQCGNTSAYVKVPAGGTIEHEESAGEPIEATCVSCDGDFRVYYTDS